MPAEVATGTTLDLESLPYRKEQASEELLRDLWKVLETLRLEAYEQQFVELCLMKTANTSYSSVLELLRKYKDEGRISERELEKIVSSTPDQARQNAISLISTRRVETLHQEIVTGPLNLDFEDFSLSYNPPGFERPVEISVTRKGKNSKLISGVTMDTRNTRTKKEDLPWNLRGQIHPSNGADFKRFFMQPRQMQLGEGEAENSPDPSEKGLSTGDVLDLLEKLKNRPKRKYELLPPVSPEVNTQIEQLLKRETARLTDKYTGVGKRKYDELAESAGSARTEIQRLQRSVRRFASGMLVSVGLLLGGGAGVAILKTQKQASSSTPTITVTEQPVRLTRNHARVDELVLPTDISDAGAILYAAAPVYDISGVYYDTVFDRYALSKHFFDGKLLLMGVKEADFKGKRERIYLFTLPSQSTGETLPKGNGVDALRSVSWADALNLATKAPQVSDEEVIEYLAWWYAETYRSQAKEGLPLDLKELEIIVSKKGVLKSVSFKGNKLKLGDVRITQDEKGAITKVEDFRLHLDPSKFKIVRGEKGEIVNVEYSGPKANEYLRFEEAVINPNIPATSSQPNRTTRTMPKPLTYNGRLNLWTGVGQDIRIPESFLADSRKVHFSLGVYGNVTFNWHHFAQSVRHYFSIRDKGTNINYNTPDGITSSRIGWGHFVTRDDAIIKVIAEEIVRGANTPFEKADRIRQYSQQVDYGWESNGVEVNRPAVATLMQGWGDCNNGSVAQASLFEAAGIDAALVYAEQGSIQKARTLLSEPGAYFSSHLLVAVEMADLGRTDLPSWNHNGSDWVLVETGNNTPFGVYPKQEQFQPVYFEPIP